MNRVIFFCGTPIWSLADGVGAPSCYNTVNGYFEAGWEVVLVNPETHSTTWKSDNFKHAVFQLPSNKSSRFKPIQWLINCRNTLFMRNYFFDAGEKILKKSAVNTVLYAYEVHAVAAAKKLSVKYNVPLVTRFQGTITYVKSDTIYNRIKYFPHFQALKTTADIVIMTNDGSKGLETLSRLGNKSKSIFFWKNGIDKTNIKKSNDYYQAFRKSIGIEKDDKMILALSRLAGWKKVDRSILAMKEIRSKEKCKLVIVGTGDAESSLHLLTKTEGLDNVIKFMGNVNHEDVSDYMNSTDIFLSLYDLGNLGNPTFEAMIAAKPIVALNYGDTSTLLTDGYNSVLIEADEIDTIPDRVVTLLKDKELALYLGENARRTINENFLSWDERIQMEINIVSELVEEWNEK